MGVACRRSNHLRAFLAVVAHEANAALQRAAVVFFVPATVGADVLIQFINIQRGELFVQLHRRMQGRSATDTRTVIVDLPIFLRLVHAFDLAAAHAMNQRHIAHEMIVPL
jgi:hypothetical protein